MQSMKRLKEKTAEQQLELRVLKLRLEAIARLIARHRDDDLFLRGFVSSIQPFHDLHRVEMKLQGRQSEVDESVVRCDFCIEEAVYRYECGKVMDFFLCGNCLLKWFEDCEESLKLLAEEE